jgi:ABC-2 type transport system ATP-binding protein
VSLAIEPGQVVGLLGKNGAGKTTLIRIAMGMLEAQEGSVRLFGMDPREEAVEVKRRVGYVSEDQILPPFLRVGEVIDLHRRLFPTWDEQMERRLCERFELPRSAKIKSLSKGQARQVALLCAVAHRPELLILDEPAGGLDPAARREFLETSIQLLNEAGSTILFSSHYMSDRRHPPPGRTSWPSMAVWECGSVPMRYTSCSSSIRKARAPCSPTS